MRLYLTCVLWCLEYPGSLQPARFPRLEVLPMNLHIAYLFLLSLLHVAWIAWAVSAINRSRSAFAESLPGPDALSKLISQPFVSFLSSPFARFPCLAISGKSKLCTSKTPSISQNWRLNVQLDHGFVPVPDGPRERRLIVTVLRV